MKYALYFDGDKIKEVDNLPCVDQDIAAMNERMQAGYEWRTIIEDATPDHDPVFEVVITTESKRAGRKLRKEKKVWSNPDWQASARSAVARKLAEYMRFDLLARDLILRSNGPAIVRAQAAIVNADALVAQIDAGTKPDLAAGWPA